MSTIDRASIDRGYGFPLEFELQKADGSPEVISGTVATWKLGASAESAVLIIKAGLVPSTVRGKTVVMLELLADETGGLAPGQYYHQLAVTLTGGQPRIYARGWLTVRDRL